MYSSQRVSRPFGIPIRQSSRRPIGPASGHVWPRIYTLSRASFESLKDLSYFNTTQYTHSLTPTYRCLTEGVCLEPVRHQLERYQLVHYQPRLADSAHT
jgi:hypothetical protein